jgi:hypothetical protein
LIDVTSEVAQIVASVVAAVGLVIVAVLGSGVRRDARVSREQLENSHSTNLREELDERHEETRGWFRSLARVVAGLAVAVAGVIAAITLNHTRLVRVETHLQRGRRR